jgi:hypothetical protein
MRNYLKSEKYGIEVSMYDAFRLTHIRVYRCQEVEINTNFDDLEDMKDSMQRDLREGYYIITEKEFYDNLNKFKEELEIITKKN